MIGNSRSTENAFCFIDCTACNEMALEQKEDNKRATHAQDAPRGEAAIALQTLEFLASIQFMPRTTSATYGYSSRFKLVRGNIQKCGSTLRFQLSREPCVRCKARVFVLLNAFLLLSIRPVTFRALLYVCVFVRRLKRFKAFNHEFNTESGFARFFYINK